MLSFLYEIDIFAGSTQFYSIAVILNIARIVNTVLPQVTVCLICLVCLCLEHLNPRYLLTMPLSQSVTSRLETSWYWYYRKYQFAKAATHTLPRKSSLDVRSVCPLCLSLLSVLCVLVVLSVPMTMMTMATMMTMLTMMALTRLWRPWRPWQDHDNHDDHDDHNDHLNDNRICNNVGGCTQTSWRLSDLT